MDKLKEIEKNLKNAIRCPECNISLPINAETLDLLINDLLFKEIVNVANPDYGEVSEIITKAIIKEIKGE